MPNFQLTYVACLLRCSWVVRIHMSHYFDHITGFLMNGLHWNKTVEHLFHVYKITYIYSNIFILMVTIESALHHIARV